MKRKVKTNTRETSVLTKKLYKFIDKDIAKVKGKKQDPIYNWLSDAKLNGWNKSAPNWNFCKYLIDENGKLVQYYPSKINPLNNEIIKHLTTAE